MTAEEAREKGEELGVTVLEPSAKTSTNVEEAFLTMAGELIRLREASQSAKPGAGGASGLKLSGGASRTKKCCPA